MANSRSDERTCSTRSRVMVAVWFGLSCKFSSRAFTDTFPASAVTDTLSPESATLNRQVASEAVQENGTIDSRGRAGSTMAVDNDGRTSSGACGVERHQISPRLSSTLLAE